MCDNCPETGNSSQDDLDTDTVGDACDNCPIDYNPFQANADSDGFGNACDDGDYDGDGFTDAEEVLCESDPADSSSMCSKGMPWLFLLLEE